MKPATYEDEAFNFIHTFYLLLLFFSLPHSFLLLPRECCCPSDRVDYDDHHHGHWWWWLKFNEFPFSSLHHYVNSRCCCCYWNKIRNWTSMPMRRMRMDLFPMPLACVQAGLVPRIGWSHASSSSSSFLFSIKHSLLIFNPSSLSMNPSHPTNPINNFQTSFFLSFFVLVRCFWIKTNEEDKDDGFLPLHAPRVYVL